MEHNILSWKYLTKENLKKESNHLYDIKFKDFKNLYKDYVY